MPLKNIVQRFAYLGFVLAAFAAMLVGKADTVVYERLRADVTDAVAPILSALSRPVATVARTVDGLRELSALRQENTRLRQQNTRLLQWQMVARKLESENRDLRELSNFNPGPAASFVTARVIADTGSVFAQSLILNAGERDGIRKGQAVLGVGGFIGRITDVGNRSSRVLLVTDINSRVPVLVERTRTRAILAGGNTDRPRLIHLPPTARVSPGDRIVTSGHGGAFPPGIPVGIVASVSDGGVRVQPFMDRDRIEFVRATDFGLDGIFGRKRAGPSAKGGGLP